MILSEKMEGGLKTGHTAQDILPNADISSQKRIRVGVCVCE